MSFFLGAVALNRLLLGDAPIVQPEPVQIRKADKEHDCQKNAAKVVVVDRVVLHQDVGSSRYDDPVSGHRINRPRRCASNEHEQCCKDAAEILVQVAGLPENRCKQQADPHDDEQHPYLRRGHSERLVCHYIGLVIDERAGRSICEESKVRYGHV